MCEKIVQFIFKSWGSKGTKGQVLVLSRQKLKDLWQLMTTYDNLWQLMTTTYDNLWQLMTTYDNLWQLMTTYDNLWQLMTTYDNLWQLMTIMTIYDNLWQFVTIFVIYDIPWLFFAANLTKFYDFLLSVGITLNVWPPFICRPLMTLILPTGFN